VAVEVHELNVHFLEDPLGQEMPLDSSQGFVRVVVSLLDKGKLLSLGLVQPRLHGISLLEPLEGENK